MAPFLSMAKILFLTLLLFVSPVTLSDEGTIQDKQNMVQYITEHVECMAKAIYFEARGEGQRGMVAVGHVVLNRVNSPKYPSDICDVVYQRHQFSWTKNPPKVTNPTLMTKAKSIAMSILRGDTKDPTKGSMYFHSSAIDPGWNKKPKAVIGNHIFY